MGCWNVLIVTRKGTVSLLKGLEKEEAIQIIRRLTPPWRIPSNYGSGAFYLGCDSDAEKLESWGPEGEELTQEEIWREKQ